MRQHDERDVVMPAAPLMMIQAQLVLQSPVVLLNRPAARGHANQAAQGGARRQVAEPVLGGCVPHCRPFHQQPDRLVRRRPLDEPMRGLIRGAPKRDASQPFVPCRQHTVFHALACVAAFAEIGRRAPTPPRPQSQR